MSFKKQLQEKLGPHEPNEVDELILDELFENVDTFTDDHKKSLELYSSLVHLSLNGFGLKSLKNFPKINTLTTLELRTNHLSGTDFGDLKALYPNLRKLKVGENPIKSLDVFKALTTFPELVKLEVQETDITKKETYRDDLFKMLPKVQVIDRMTRDGDEVDTTINEDDDMDEENFDEEGGDEDYDDEDDDDSGDYDEDDDDDDEEEAPKSSKKPRKN